MKRTFISVIGLCVALASCASGVQIGDCKPNDPRPECNASNTLPPSETPTRTKTAKPKKTKTAEPTPTQTEPQIQRAVYKMVIRGGDQQFFLYKVPGEKDWRFADQGGPRVRTGDVIVFQNLDSQNKHSWTSGASATAADNGKLFDSGLLDYKETYRWVVADKPGCYRYHDEYVNYIQGGPLEIVPRDTLEPQNCK